MLKVPREIGKKGSKVNVQFSTEAVESFQKVKETLCKKLLLLRVDPDKPFILRTDASRYAVGASLEQLPEEDRLPTAQDVLNKKNSTSGIYVPKTH